MCTKNQLECIVKEVVQHAKNTFGKQLDNVILYGSYARGDYTCESDIDIMVIVSDSPEVLKKHTRSFCVLSSNLGLEYDIVVSVTIKDAETFNKYADVLPFYKNVLKEGVFVA